MEDERVGRRAPRFECCGVCSDRRIHGLRRTPPSTDPILKKVVSAVIPLSLYIVSYLSAQNNLAESDWTSTEALTSIYTGVHLSTTSPYTSTAIIHYFKANDPGSSPCCAAAAAALGLSACRLSVTW